MAVKKKSGGVKKSATKKAAPKKAAKGASAGTGTKTGTPKKSTKGGATKVKAKKAAPVKLTDKQADFLKSIHSAGEAGYKGDKKGESKSLEALLGKKLIKRGAKDKASGHYSYSVSKAGHKHLGGSSPKS
jgi:hypothetical protein